MGNERRASEWSIDEALNSVGNLSYLTRYLHHYGSEIARRKEAEGDLSNAPMYYAWLSTASELVYSLIKDLLHWDRIDVAWKKEVGDVFNADYAAVLNALSDHKLVDDKLREDVLLFARIRHSIVHKGFPNLHASAARACRPLAKDCLYTEAEAIEVLDLISEPRNYPTLLEAFRRVSKGIRSLQTRPEYRFQSAEQDGGTDPVRDA